MSNRLSRAAAGLRPAALLAAVASSGLLAACGGSGTSTNAAASVEANREQRLLRFAKCLREHGVDISTPAAGGRIRVQSKAEISPQRFEAARNACREYAPADKLELTPQERVEREEAVRKFAKCMREHGIELEAKTAEGGAAIGIHVGRGEGGPNPESPTFQAAQKACQSYLPKPPPGARLGRPPGGPPARATSRSGGGQAGPDVGFQLGG
jgi:hypothetical protein